MGNSVPTSPATTLLILNTARAMQVILSSSLKENSKGQGIYGWGKGQNRHPEFPWPVFLPRPCPSLLLSGLLSRRQTGADYGQGLIFVLMLRLRQGWTPEGGTLSACVGKLKVPIKQSHI